MRKQFTLQELAQFTNATVVGNSSHVISGVESLDLAETCDASFLANPLYEKAMRKSNAGVIFVNAGIEIPENRNFLIVENPSLAFQMTAEAILGKGRSVTGFKGIHSTAVIHPTAKIGSNVTIGPFAVIDEDVSIGNDTVINAHCYIGPYTAIGSNCLIHANVTIRESCQIGNNVILQPGAVIGSCGFGYLTSREGKHSKLNQLGGVTIGDDVEIGANSTIDRARLNHTEIKRGSKIDNLVQIGHGVSVDEDNIIVAQTGIAGSTKTGKRVIIGGQVAVAGHLKICSDVMVGGRSAIGKSIDKPGKYAGHPLLSLTQHNRNSVLLRNISQYIDKIKALENKLKDE